MIRSAGILVISTMVILSGCADPGTPTPAAGDTATPMYLDYSGRDDVLSGGVKMIPVETSKGTFRVWTKRIGNNADVKVLTLYYYGDPGNDANSSEQMSVGLEDGDSNSFIDYDGDNNDTAIGIRACSTTRHLLCRHLSPPSQAPVDKADAPRPALLRPVCRRHHHSAPAPRFGP